jgi:hypothetical protein
MHEIQFFFSTPKKLERLFVDSGGQETPLERVWQEVHLHLREATARHESQIGWLSGLKPG